MTLLQKIEKLTWFSEITKLKNILKDFKSYIDSKISVTEQAITALQINTSITGYIDFTTMSNTLIYYNDVDTALVVTQNVDDSITFTITNGGFTTNKTVPIMPGANVVGMTTNTLQIETSTSPQLYFKIEVYV